MTKRTSISAEEIDALLPQTQCGLCGFSGCMPYAKALQKREATINLCPPGGVEGLTNLGQLLNTDPIPYIKEMRAKEKPSSVAVIRESECIGCTKCIQACPVDAILGTNKQMHTVISDECTGCELCIPPCPVDCIDLTTINHSESKDMRATKYRHRYQARNKRLTKARHQKSTTDKKPTTWIDKKAYIAMAIKRAKEKKESSG